MKMNETLTPALSRRPRGRPRTFDRDQVLARAMQVFWEKGYEAASMQDLLAAMNLSSPSLYAAFGDKESLFIEAVQRYVESVREECECSGEYTARESIEWVLTELTGIFTDRSHPPGCLAVIAFMTSASTSPRVQKLLAEQRAETRSRFRSIIEGGVKKGELARGTDTLALTDFYIAVISGMSLSAREGASRKTLLGMVQTALRAWPEAPKKAKKKVVHTA
jgi:AcrR family transcriptional regulator